MSTDQGKMEYRLENGMQYEVENGHICGEEDGRIYIQGATYHKFEWWLNGMWTYFNTPITANEMRELSADAEFLSAFELFSDVRKIHVARMQCDALMLPLCSLKGGIEFRSQMTLAIAKRICSEEWAYDETLLKLDAFSSAVFDKANELWRPYFGYVYLTSKLEGYYKIGRSFDPIQRIETLGILLPRPLIIEHLIECRDYYQAEDDLHKRYAHCRVRGEWFALTPQDIADIKAIKEL